MDEMKRRRPSAIAFEQPAAAFPLSLSRMRLWCIAKKEYSIWQLSPCDCSSCLVRVAILIHRASWSGLAPHVSSWAAIGSKNVYRSHPISCARGLSPARHWQRQDVAGACPSEIVP